MPDQFLTALLGGFCIGLASILMMWMLGRIAGISGITWQALQAPRTNNWAIMFVAGLAFGAAGYHLVSSAPIPAFNVPLPLILAGGFLVGFGTKLGSGCTSGHGICGIGRLSMRSIVATVTFMSFGILTVFVTRHMLISGGVS